MKRGNIYREAARQIFTSNLHHTGLAWLHTEHRDLFDAFNALDTFGYESFYNQSVSDLVLALCLMGAIADRESRGHG